MDNNNDRPTKHSHLGRNIVGRLPPRPDTHKRNSIGSHLVMEKKRDFLDYYDVVRQIGHGSISNIYLVRKKKKDAEASPSTEEGGDESAKATEVAAAADRDRVYALKQIDLSLVEQEFEHEMRNEIQLMRVMDHPNIERIFEVYQHPTKGYLSIVMEYCSGGDLSTRAPYSERQAQSVVWCLCEALSYMHTPTPEVVIHRDIKFANIMFESTAEDAQIKLIDFGLSTKFGKTKLEARVGSVYTMAPEVITRDGYDTKADMWSAGVVTYQLLAGTPPFWGEGGNPKATAKLVVEGSYSMDGPEWQSISADAKNFVAKLLRRLPETRMSAKNALKHPWLRPLAFTKKDDIDYDFIGKCYDNAKDFANSSDFHKLALQAIARKATVDDVVELRRAFHVLDGENDGVITYRELLRVLGGRYPASDIRDLFSRIDVDASGSVNYTEFLAATMGVNCHIAERNIQEAFDVFDTDDSGYISREDLRQMLGEVAQESFVNRLLDEADVDHNGEISFEEFKQLFRDRHKEEAVKGLQAD
jgi:calcium-dependent protein kinase